VQKYRSGKKPLTEMSKLLYPSDLARLGARSAAPKFKAASGRKTFAAFSLQKERVFTRPMMVLTLIMILKLNVCR
jgi:hypothetical protein